MPRLVRRQPLAERIRSYLNPLDFLLWLSEEIDANAWDQFEKDWALPLGVVLNLTFLIARANSRSSGTRAIDDVFGDDDGVPWMSWFRLYRLFEASIDQPPATPSARRVRVDSNPMAASPLRYFANVIAGSAESRAHPDAQRDVWELAVWDPLPICLRLFCLFSPGHVLVYWVFLPTQLSDPRPSVTIVTTIFITTLLSVQMSFLSSSFTQQAKDSMVVHKEVLNEYDTKFVHPRTQPVMRDVGTQFSDPNTSQPGSDAKYNKVDTFTPTRVIHRGFKTSPNPNYVSFVDPEGASPRRQTFTTPNASHNYTSLQTPSHLRDASPVVRGPVASIRQPHFRPTPSATGDGGSLGIFSHANSPLRRSTPANIDRRVPNPPEFLFKDRGTPMKRLSSPLKKSNVPGSATPLTSTPRRTQNDLRRETGRF
ncbi:hypothetical protein KXX19_003235 [Aspergillus fumigatus]|nr:hypothetical protein KXX19_003235 [Aspergillus fumigatus]KAH2841429.1 hypothetical protein KXV85_001418 [Aspergillus fumigatus]KAH2950578.1 hypothetical protein KXW00_003892 [Aspergillus fumigatus]